MSIIINHVTLITRVINADDYHAEAHYQASDSQLLGGKFYLEKPRSSKCSTSRRRFTAGLQNEAGCGQQLPSPRLW